MRLLAFAAKRKCAMTGAIDWQLTPEEMKTIEAALAEYDKVDGKVKDQAASRVKS